jgi:cytochrome c oxidase subunit 3
MIMFIASEVMFFVAWFWAFFDASLFYDEAQQVARTAFTGGQWPPAGIEVLDPLHLPLYNTVILLLSGTTVTWAHHALLHGDRKGLIYGLTLTVILGMIFSASRPTNMQLLRSTSRTRSTAPHSTWRPASTVSTF